MSTPICGAIRDFGKPIGYPGLIVHKCRKPEGHGGQHHSPQLEGRTDGGPTYWTGDNRNEATP